MIDATTKLFGGVCENPTKKFPNGRTGTAAGYNAHIRAGETSCEACATARRDRHKEWRDSLSGEKREIYLRKSKEATRRYAAGHADEIKKASAKSLRKRQRFIQRLKESSPCSDCGKFYPYYVMQFDHVRGTKVSKISGWGVNIGVDRLLEEISKCELVCGNCHKKRTQERMGEERSYARPRSWTNRGLIREAKSVPCSDCGIQYPYYVMEFDHVRGEKKFNIGALGVNSKTSVLMEEIQKCDVVCCNCHAERSYQRLTRSDDIAC